MDPRYTFDFHAAARVVKSPKYKLIWFSRRQVVFIQISVTVFLAVGMVYICLCPVLTDTIQKDFGTFRQIHILDFLVTSLVKRLWR